MARVSVLRVLALLALPLAVAVVGARMEPEIDWSRPGSHRASVNIATRTLSSALRDREEFAALRRGQAARRVTTRGPVTVVAGNDRSLPYVEKWLEAAEAELASMPGRVGALTPVTVVLTRSEGFSWWGRRFPAPLDTACTIVSNPEDPPRRPSSINGFPAVLGQCALVAVFGPAGQGVKRWSSGVGTRISGAPFLDRLRWWGPEESDSLIQVGHYLTNEGRPGEIGNRGDLEVTACRAGESPRCRVVLGRGFGAGLRGDFVWWLLERDPARFARLWRSDLPLDEAFLRELGEPMGSLAAQWARERFRVVNAGPSLRAGMWSDLAIVLLLAALVSVLAVRRRAVA